MCILIVDDCSPLRKRLKKVIEGMNPDFMIIEAATGAEALKFLKSFVPETVVLDISLPDISGIEILKEIKLNKPDTRVLIFTNHPSPEFRERCIKLGAEYFFDKSVDYRNMLDLFGRNFQE